MDGCTIRTIAEYLAELRRRRRNHYRAGQRTGPDTKSKVCVDRNQGSWNRNGRFHKHNKG